MHFLFCKLVSILESFKNLQSHCSRCQQCPNGKPLLALVQKFNDTCPKDDDTCPKINKIDRTEKTYHVAQSLSNLFLVSMVVARGASWGVRRSGRGGFIKVAHQVEG